MVRESKPLDEWNGEEKSEKIVADLQDAECVAVGGSAKECLAVQGRERPLLAVLRPLRAAAAGGRVATTLEVLSGPVCGDRIGTQCVFNIATHRCGA